MSPTKSQQEAIRSWGRKNICVVAGPGSGKTRVLTERIRWLVDEKKVEPASILAITFTRKAAASMYRRLTDELPLESDLRRRLERAQISTIDAFCARALREYALEAKIDPDFEILPPAEADFELRRVMDDTLNAVFEEDPPAAFRFLRAFKGAHDAVDEAEFSKVHQQFQRLVETVRNSGAQPFAALQTSRNPAETAWAVDVARRILANFANWKRSRGVLDFPDLSEGVIALLEAGVDLRAGFEQILVDEFQDTNPRQARLVGLLQERASRQGAVVFVVGDANQSIYAFRNADPGVFAEFERQAGRDGQCVELLDNFRSRQEILDAARALTKAPGVVDRELRAAREFPPKQEPSIDVLVVRAKETRSLKRREGDWIARRILELRETLSIRDREADSTRRPDWRDFAVLVRTNQLLDVFAEGLRSAGVPYQLNAGRGFFDTHEVRDLLAFLRALDNPRDEISLAAVLRSPFVGVGDGALLRMKTAKRNLGLAISDPPPLAAEDHERLSRFAELFGRLRDQREDAPLNILLHRILSASGYEAWLLEQPGGGQRAANVQKLARIAARVSADQPSFRRAVERIEEYRAIGGGEAEATVPEDAADAVHLMTIHMAKGLEFPVVLAPSIQAQSRSESDSFLFSAEKGLGARWLDPKSGEAVEDPVYSELHQQQKEEERREAARILYVALTRAEEHLVLSAAWGPQIRRSLWARLLEDGLGIEDLGAIDEAPIECKAKSFRFRLFRTDRQADVSPVQRAEAARFTTVDRVRPAAPGGQADSEAPVTAVALFAECPRKYYLSRYLGLAGETTVKSEVAEPGAADLGRRTHELLAGAPVGTDPLDHRAAILAEAFRLSPLGQATAAARHVEHEIGLLFPVGVRLLRGVVDLLFEDATGRTIVDYKTDQIEAREVPERASRYDLQLQLYALGLERAGRRPDRALLHFLRPGQAVEVDLSAAALARAAEIVEAFFQAQERQSFPLRPAERCRRCPYFRNLCPAEPPLGDRTAPAARGQLALPF